MSRLRLAFRILAIVVACGPHSTFAGSTPPVFLDEFRRIEILHEGRLKPLDTYARMLLLQLSGRSSQDGRPAIEWMAGVLFDPAGAVEQHVFRIDHPDLLAALDLLPEEKHRYGFDRLVPVLGRIAALARDARTIEEAERSAFDAEAIRLSENVQAYIGLVNALSFLRPHRDFALGDSGLRSRLSLPQGGGESAFLDVWLALPRIRTDHDLAEDAAARNGAHAELLQTIAAWTRYHRDAPLAILPPSPPARDRWASPWELLAAERRGDADLRGVMLLRSMGEAYRERSGHGFRKAAGEFAAWAGRLTGRGQADLEVRYNDLDLFYRAEILYGLALLATFLHLLLARAWLRRLAWGCALAALLAHSAGLAMRIALTGRPPVTSLFETFLFVGFATACLGLVLERYHRRGGGLLVASFSGLALLLVSGRFGGDGDSLRVLVAVLDSNFWLTWHVLAISLGYAGVCVSALLGHLLLFESVRRRKSGQEMDSLARMVFGTQAFGLAFTFAGTMLGGIWADQSWGRFWGWDPKENGALLIILWSAALFHARLAGRIGRQGMAVGSILGGIVVAFAWFGINFLGVGLHSYGFDAGARRGFQGFLGLEVLFFAATLPLLRSGTASEERLAEQKKDIDVA